MKRITFVCFLFLMNHVFSTSSNLILYTYPRTGTNFLTYTIRQILYKDDSTSTSPYVNRFANYHGSTEYYRLCKERRRRPSINPRNDYLILLVRNYREAFLRNFCNNIVRIMGHIKDDSSDWTTHRYFKNLEDYDRWNPRKRLLVYYEDLMANPHEQIKRIATFLRSDERLLRDFLKDYEKHREKCLIHYNKLHNHTDYSSTKTMGKDLLYYSRQIPYETLKEMDEAVRSRNRTLYKKYLSRYNLFSKKDLQGGKLN